MNVKRHAARGSPNASAVNANTTANPTPAANVPLSRAHGENTRLRPARRENAQKSWLLPRVVRGEAMPLSYGGAVINLVKGYVGSGVLSLPYVTNEVGLLVSIPGMALVAFLNGVGVMRFIRCMNPAGFEKVAPVPAHDYGLGHSVDACGAAFGFAGTVASVAAILGGQIATVISYVTVIVQTLHVILPHAGDMAIYGGLIALYFGLCLFRDMSVIAYVSVLSLLTYALLFYLLIYCGIDEVADEGWKEDALEIGVPTWKRLLTWLGVVIWSFEGINTAQLVYVAMDLRDPAPFESALMVAYVSGFFVFTAVSVWTCFCYGDKIEFLFYFNFPSGLWTTFAQGILGIVLSLTFPLQMFPVFSFLESGSEELRRRYGVFVPWLVVRVLLVMGIFFVAYIFPDPIAAVSLTGAFCFGIVGFILPGACHLKLAKPTAWQALVDAALVLVGLVAIALSIKDVTS